MKQNQGLSLIELLVVAALMGVVLAVLSAYFSTQLRVSAQVQARNELQTRLRSVAEIMMQDLQIAGSRAIYDGTSVQYLEPVHEASTRPAEPTEPDDPTDPATLEWANWKARQCSEEYRDGCVRVARDGVNLRIYYTTSLERAGSSACRRIDYVLDADGMLFRRDVACADTTTGLADYSFASGIDSLTLSFICHDPDTTVPDLASCYGSSTYPREASIRLSGHAENAREPMTSSITLATSLPNLRPPVDYLDLN